MATLSNSLSRKASVTQITNLKMEMNLKMLTKHEKKALFDEKTMELKRIGLTFKQQSELTGIDYKRFKTIRSDAPPNLYPRIYEIEAVLKLHSSKFEKSEPDPQEAKPIANKIQELEERLRKQEAFNDSTKVNLVQRLTELEERNSTLKDEIKRLKKLLNE